MRRVNVERADGRAEARDSFEDAKWMTHPGTSQPVAKGQGVSTREVIIPHAAKRSGGSRPVKLLLCTLLSLALIKPIKRELQQEVGILELDFAGLISSHAVCTHKPGFVVVPPLGSIGNIGWT